VSSARILSDLIACERNAADHVTMIEKIGRPLVVRGRSRLLASRLRRDHGRARAVGQRRRDYTKCMEPRGYVVSAWKADPSPMPRAGESP